MSIEDLNKKIEEVNRDDDVLSVIKGYGDVLANLEKTIREKEEEIKSLKQEQKQIAERTLPDIMDDAGINEVTLANGTKIECKDYIFARIKDEFTAFNYLRDKGEDSIIDNRIQVNLPKGFEQAAQMLMNFLEQNNLIAWLNKRSPCISSDWNRGFVMPWNVKILAICLKTLLACTKVAKLSSNNLPH